MIIYKGIPERTRRGGFKVYRDNRLLSPKASQRLINHSLDGFNWGYGGSGPAQLALALLYDATGDRERALRYYQDFKWQYIAGWRNEWRITSEEILAWLDK